MFEIPAEIQGSVISQILISIMIIDVYLDIGSDIGRSLCAFMEKGSTCSINPRKDTKCNQNGREMVIWGFRFSVEQTKFMIFSRKR